MAVVVIGAGMAGVACARVLADAGIAVQLRERAQHVGGRLAAPVLHGRPVDLGAAYFTVRDPEFAQLVGGWRERHLARPWTAELGVLGADGSRDTTAGPVRWAAPGGLRSLVADLADDLDVALGAPVGRVGPGPVVDGEPADAVVVAMPDPQAARLLDPATAAAGLVADRAWQPVITVAAGFAARDWAPLTAAFVNDHPVLSLVADDGNRRGDGASVLVAHSTGDLARAHDADPDGAIAPVLAALRDLLGVVAAPRWTVAHRWRCAKPSADRDAEFHLADRIGLAGDGWGASKVETAWWSGTALGRALVGDLGTR